MKVYRPAPRSLVAAVKRETETKMETERAKLRGPDATGVEASVAKSSVNISSDSGEVVLVRGNLQGMEGPPIRLFDQNRANHLLRVSVGAQGHLEASRCRLTELVLGSMLPSIHSRAQPA